MSVSEDDVELRDLLAQTLEKNGCMAKIRAQLRASIFLALDEDIKLSTQEPLQNREVRSYLETPEGQVMFCIVREFLEFFNLQETVAVYEAETYHGKVYNYESRQQIIQDVGLEEDSKVPLLQQLLRIAQMKNNNKCKVNSTIVNDCSSNGHVDEIEDSSSLERPHPNQRPDKCNSKSLSSLSDLTSMQINKTRVTDILPSLYSKEFKEKSSLKELEKMFDQETEYEETFSTYNDFALNSPKEIVQNKMDSEKLSVYKKKDDLSSNASELSVGSVPAINQGSESNKSIEGISHDSDGGATNVSL
ncbi:centrosomal protein 43-like [Cylas formicarius]|uniref:centrosomal protein 43-like n=1 Tax=Cylas formicarius TaxID=197179 RepID=UPI0029584257|nr:centrosomal protein 43-like [Cylas formicarius]